MAIYNREDYNTVLPQLEKRIKELEARVKPLEEQGKITSLAISWGGTTVNLKKRGNCVHGVIWNPRTVSAGNNSITTLPVGWRPATDCVWTVKAPNSTSSGVEIRYSIVTSGAFNVYNYGSAWTNTDSNITASFMYIVQ